MTCVDVRDTTQGLSCVACQSKSKTRHYDLALTWEYGAPDGFGRKVFKINGQFPGPTLELNEGDHVVVHVKNLTPYSTTVHYHGIEMLGTPEYDGVPGITQKRIPPSCSFTYKWKATQHGSFFYHAHSDSQINDGLYGPIIIHPASTTPVPYQLITNSSKSLAAIKLAETKRIPLLLSDWRHITSDYEWELSQKSGVETPCFDSMLVNGKGKVICLSTEEQAVLITANQQMLLGFVPGSNLTDKSCLPAPVIATRAAPGAPAPNFDIIPANFFYGCTETQSSSDVIKITQETIADETWAMFDLIGSLALQNVQVSFDELTMYVIEADGNYIEPQAVHSLLITNGQRYTVVLKLENPRRYTFRVSGISDPQILFGTAVLDFKIKGTNQSTIPTVPYINEVGVNTTGAVVPFDFAGTKSFLPQPIPQAPDATFKMTMRVDGQVIYWAFNETILPLNYDDVRPPLLFAPQPDRQDNHTITIHKNNTWVDYIMMVPGVQPAHPVHVHGRHFYVLGSGEGNFTWDTVEEAAAAVPESFNLVNPPLRDTIATPFAGPSGSWLAIRRPSDNPGVWLMHCHIQSHIQGGMSMIIQDGIDDLPAIPAEYGWTC
ncbi:multicopper oxidase [Pseudomassariella vexata]|uniref:Multicopper oxidase n=1 Tax=Pseudomassariella vexata TaxID=1141098 RepID=A0A1Y2D9N7_9PEZI|nr:multicopper oxidase [Pseudomassariella vexata]ORY55894.1 multicopper oxidase [Pseudomassariella vexata]